METPLLPPEFITASFSAVSMSDSPTLVAIQAFDSVLPLLSESQIFTMISIVIQTMETTLSEESILPTENISLIRTVFSNLKHEPIFTFLMAQMQDLISRGNLAIAILLYLPIVNSASEQISNHLDSTISLLKSGLTAGDRFSAQSACVILSETHETEDIQSAIPDFFPLLLPLLTDPDRDTRLLAYSALQSMLRVDLTYPDLFPAVWSIRSQIPENEASFFMNLLGDVLSRADPIPDPAVHEVASFLSPFISQADDLLLTSSGLCVLSHLIPHSEPLVLSILPQTVAAVNLCLSSGSPDVIVNVLEFVSEVIESYREQSLDFVLELWGAVSALLSRKRQLECVRQTRLYTAAQIAGLSRNSDHLGIVLRTLSAEFAGQSVAAIRSARKVAKFVSSADAAAIFTKICEICGSTKDSDDVVLSFETLGHFLKHSSPENLPDFVALGTGLIHAFFAGELPVLAGRSILDSAVDVDISLIDALFGLLTDVVSVNAEFADELCRIALALVERPEPYFRNVVLQLFIDAIEAGTVSPETVESLFLLLAGMLESENLAIRQNITYFTILVLRKNSDMLAQILELVPVFGNWWVSARENPSGCALLISNLASLFLFLCACHDIEFEIGMIIQFLGVFPPDDKTEAAFMAENLLRLVQKPMADEVRVAAGIAIGKLMTQTQKNLRKMKIDLEVSNGLVLFFRELCRSNEEMGQTVFAEFAGSAAKVEQLLAIVNV
jgi:hypothetical protein